MPSARTAVALGLCGGGYVLDLAGLDLAPLLAQAPDGSLFPGGSSVGVGMVLAGIITALGANIIIPLIKERNTLGRLNDAEARVKLLEEESVRNKEAERNFLEKLSALADKNTKLTDMNTRLTDMNLTFAQTILVNEGKQRLGPAPTSETFLVDDDGLAGAGTGPSVLLVEDSEAAMIAVKKVLELRGCRVECAADLPHALEALERVKPAYVVLDLMLPGGDGIEVLKRVRDFGLATKVIVTTGRDEDGLGAVRALKPLALFTKPFDLWGDLMPLIKKTEPVPAPHPRGP